jgi:LysR family nitrogen assimilation transcriptional regulator
VALEIDSIPAILDLVQQEPMYVVLSLSSIKSTGNERNFYLRPVCKPKLMTTLWIATSAQRPRGPLIDRSTELVRELLIKLWA